MARPPHPLDEPGDAARRSRTRAGARRSSTGACRSRSGTQKGAVTASCSGCPRARRRPSRRSWRSVVIVLAGDRVRAVRAQAPRARRRTARPGLAPRARRASGAGHERPGDGVRRSRLLGALVVAIVSVAALAVPAGLCPRAAARHLAAIGLDRGRSARRGDLQVQPGRRRDARRGARLQRPGQRGRQPRRLPSRRPGALDGRRPEGRTCPTAPTRPPTGSSRPTPTSSTAASCSTSATPARRRSSRSPG